jgi:peptidyl-prolyl cis-trans isomerase B (cyclophilin B)
MKRFPFLPLLCVLCAGCSAPAQEQAAAPTDNAPKDAAAPTTPKDAPVPTPTPAKAKTYKVTPVDPASLGGAPADMVANYMAAMKKVALPTPPLDTKIAAKPRVILNTSRGPITLELDSKAAPLHVRSFLYLSGKGFYDGTKFHRYADLTGDGKGYIIQGGDPLSKSAATMNFAGMGGPGYAIPREFNDLKHDKLVIAAARSQDPDSAGSQFYITQDPVSFLDEGDGYTVFGKVVAGTPAALRLRQGDVIKSIKIEK